MDLVELVRLGGGPDRVSVLQVPYTQRQVEDYRDEIGEALTSAGVVGATSIDATDRGLRIVITVEDVEQVPDSFGDHVPRWLYSVREGDPRPRAASSGPSEISD